MELCTCLPKKIDRNLSFNLLYYKIFKEAFQWNLLDHNTSLYGKTQAKT